MDGSCGGETHVALVKLRSAAEAVTRAAERSVQHTATHHAFSFKADTQADGSGRGRGGAEWGWEEGAHICLTDHKTCDSCKQTNKQKNKKSARHTEARSTRDMH